MKVLLDENIDVRFKNYFANNYEVFTVKDLGWNGIKNGELLILLKQKKFNAWIVVDKNIPYQQNIANLPCLVIVLDVYRNTLKYLIALVPKIMAVLDNQKEEKIVIVN